MKHRIVDTENRILPNWAEAMPLVELLTRDAALDSPGLDAGICWCRLRAGEDIAELAGVLSASRVPAVVLSDTPSEAQVVAALSAGAAGLCNTHAAPEVLQQVALVVGNGGLWVGQSLLQQLLGSTARILGQRPVDRKNDDWSASLSEREVQVARLVAAGESNKEIARHLEITERTVKAHLTAVFDKLGLRDRLQLSLRINGVNA